MQPMPQKKLDYEMPIKAACPSCNNQTLVRGTKDAVSEFLGLVYCTSTECTFEETLQQFRAPAPIVVPDIQ